MQELKKQQLGFLSRVSQGFKHLPREAHILCQQRIVDAPFYLTLCTNMCCYLWIKIKHSRWSVLGRAAHILIQKENNFRLFGCLLLNNSSSRIKLTESYFVKSAWPIWLSLSSLTIWCRLIQRTILQSLFIWPPSHWILLRYFKRFPKSSY